MQLGLKGPPKGVICHNIDDEKGGIVLEAELKQGFFTKPRRLWVHIIIYTVLIFAIIAGCVLTLLSYEKFQPIVMEATTPLTTQELVDGASIETANGSIVQHITEEDLSRLLFAKLADYNPPIGQNVTLESYYYDTKEGISYFNFIDSGDKLYSFVATTDLQQEGSKLVLSLKDFKLGKYKLGPLGKFYSRKLDITDRIEIDFNDSNKMIYINDIDIEDRNSIICNYTYDIQIIKQRFQKYKDQIDNHKRSIYTKDDETIREFAQMLDNLDTYGEDGIGKWMSKLQSDRHVVENCALILKDSGVREMCGDFQILHNNTLQPERLIEVSQNELNYALMQYHRDFSRILLNYLYINRGYNYSNGQLVLNGSLLDAGRILSEKGKESLYNVELISDEEGLSAYYHTGDEGIKKLILRKE